MKKIITLSLTILIAITTSINIFALTKENISNSSDFYDKVIDETVQTVEFNEYDEFKKIQSMSEEELLASGWTSQEIEEIKTFDFEKELKKREIEKVLLGNSSRDISILSDELERDWSEEEISARAATINLVMGMSTVTNGGRDWTLYYEWHWTDRPVFAMTDIFGVRALGSVNGTVAIPVVLEKSSNTTYYYWHGGGIAESKTVNYSRVDLNLAESKVELQGMKDNLKTLARSGYGYIYFNNTVGMDRLTVCLQYGHSQLTTNPSLSASVGTDGASAGVGIDFSYGVSTEKKLLKVYNPDTTEVN